MDNQGQRILQFCKEFGSLGEYANDILSKKTE